MLRPARWPLIVIRVRSHSSTDLMGVVTEVWADGGADPASWAVLTALVAEQSAPSLWIGILLGVLAALATLIGWLIAAARRSWPPGLQAGGLILAAAAMTALSLFEMVPNARASGLNDAYVAGLFLLGCALALGTVLLARLVLSSHSRLARAALVVAVVIGVHNIPEGSITVGVAMLSIDAAVLTSVVIALQNIPEGLAVATPVIAAGGSRLRALAYTGVATAGEILGVLLSAGYVAVMTPERTGGLSAFVAGVMVTISAVELAPAAVRILRGGVPAGSLANHDDAVSH